MAAGVQIDLLIPDRVLSVPENPTCRFFSGSANDETHDLRARVVTTPAPPRGRTRLRVMMHPDFVKASEDGIVSAVANGNLFLCNFKIKEDAPLGPYSVLAELGVVSDAEGNQVPVTIKLFEGQVLGNCGSSCL